MLTACIGLYISVKKLELPFTKGQKCSLKRTHSMYIQNPKGTTAVVLLCVYMYIHLGKEPYSLGVLYRYVLQDTFNPAYLIVILAFVLFLLTDNSLFNPFGKLGCSYIYYSCARCL